MREIVVQFAIKDESFPKTNHFKKWVTAALLDSVNEAEICVRIVDTDEMQALNKQYRNKDKPTNVLSFPYHDPVTAADTLQGDVVICAPVVAHEASATGCDLIAHWAHMVVHGTLHIQGYDHENEHDAAKMEQLEIDILAKLGFNNPYRSQ